MDSRNAIAMIEADGWYLVRVKGSHHQFKHPTKGAGYGKASTERHTVTNTEKYQKQAGLSAPYWRFTCCTLLLLIKAIHPSAFAYLISLAASLAVMIIRTRLKAYVKRFEAHIELLVEDGETVPEATTVENWLSNPEYTGAVWALVDVDITRLMGKAEKINVTLPSLLIRRIDQFVAAHPEYGSRSGFLSRVAADKVINQR